MKRRDLCRPLALRAETIRQLSSVDLERRRIDGGGIRETAAETITWALPGCSNGCSQAE